MMNNTSNITNTFFSIMTNNPMEVAVTGILIGAGALYLYLANRHSSDQIPYTPPDLTIVGNEKDLTLLLDMFDGQFDDSNYGLQDPFLLINERFPLTLEDKINATTVNKALFEQRFHYIEQRESVTLTNSTEVADFFKTVLPRHQTSPLSVKALQFILSNAIPLKAARQCLHNLPGLTHLTLQINNTATMEMLQGYLQAASHCNLHSLVITFADWSEENEGNFNDELIKELKGLVYEPWGKRQDATGITNLPRELTGLKNIVSLRIDGIHSLRNVGISLSAFPKLKQLELSNMDYLTSLPLGFSHCQALEEVTFSGLEAITTFPASICQIKNLKRLTIEGMEYINTLPDLSPLSQLEVLDIRDVGLKKFPSSIKNLTHLKQLTLGNLDGLKGTYELDCTRLIHLEQVVLVKLYNTIEVNNTTHFTKIKYD